MGKLVKEAAQRANELSDYIVPTDYEPILSMEQSWGGKARKLWEERFAGQEKLFQNSETVYTGIGGAPGENGIFPIKRYGDGSVIPMLVDLKQKFGRIPDVLFLPASPLFSEGIIGLKGLARTYKEMGVKKVIVLLTSLAHERQDHVFFATNGHLMPQVTMLKDVIDTLALDGSIDAGVILQPHSLRSVELALRIGFPLLPLDATRLVTQQSGLENIENIFIMGPDKGRKDDAKIIASQLHCPMGSAVKTRDRIGNGAPKLEIDSKILRFIKNHNCNVVMFDDEIREGGTTFGMAEALTGYAASVTICAVKGFFANVTGRSETAIDYLQHPLIRRIVVTDAVKPLNEVDLIQNKLEVIPLEHDLANIVTYLRQQSVQPANPQWLRDSSKTNTLLRLDISVEQIE